MESSDKLSSALRRLPTRSENRANSSRGNTDLALDKSADATMAGIADDLDVVDLSVGGEVIVESTDQLPVIHSRG